jgi:hypothetical protein
VLTLLVGPAIALFPKRWRERFALTPDEWKLAGSISGFLESVAALAALVGWYSYSVTHWAKDAIFSTADAHPQAAIPSGTEGFAALVLLLFHPFTWFIFYCGTEGTVRLLASAIGGTTFGILPLYLVERCYSLLLSRRSKLNSSEDSGAAADSLTTRTDTEGEILEIRSLKPKEEWIPPKIIHFRGVYYRLVQTYEERAKERNFVFLLRRLPAGVPSWTVIEYSSDVISTNANPPET